MREGFKTGGGKNKVGRATGLNSEVLSKTEGKVRSKKLLVTKKKKNPKGGT